MSSRLFTSECVTEDHPDKIADRISDTLLDALPARDPAARVAVETLITTGQVHVAGEVTTSAYGGMARHGGGAFSGKDPSKVNRSAAYGHFGRELPDFTRERTDRSDALREAAGL